MTKKRIMIITHDEKNMLKTDFVEVANEKEFTKVVKDTIKEGPHTLFEIIDSYVEKDGDTAHIDLYVNEEYLLFNAIPTVSVMNSERHLVQVIAGNMVVAKHDPETGGVGHLSDEDIQMFYTKYERSVLPKVTTKAIADKHTEVYDAPEADWAGRQVETFIITR